MDTSSISAPAHASAQPAIRGLWWKVATGLWMVLGIVAVFTFIGPAIGSDGRPTFTMAGHGAKVFLFHMPCAWLTSGAYIAAAWYAWRFLRGLARRGFQASLEDDLKCAAAAELGLLFGILTTVTGSIFSKNEWGAYWSW